MTFELYTTTRDKVTLTNVNTVFVTKTEIQISFNTMDSYHKGYKDLYETCSVSFNGINKGIRYPRLEIAKYDIKSYKEV